MNIASQPSLRAALARPLFIALLLLGGCASSTRPDSASGDDASSADALADSPSRTERGACAPVDRPQLEGVGECTAADQRICRDWAQSMVDTSAGFAACVSVTGHKWCERADNCQVINQGLSLPAVDCHCGSEDRCGEGWVCAGSGGASCVRPCSL